MEMPALKKHALALLGTDNLMISNSHYKEKGENDADEENKK